MPKEGLRARSEKVVDKMCRTVARARFHIKIIKQIVESGALLEDEVDKMRTGL